MSRHFDPIPTPAISGHPAATWLRTAAFSLLALCLAAPALHAQAYASAELRGTVLDGFEDPVSGALVTLWASGEWTGAEVTTRRDGSFGLDAVRPGVYELRVEALGFHPVVLTGVQVRPSGSGAVVVKLREGTPPITVVDTTRAAAGGPATERWVSTNETGLPLESRELREGLELVTTMDRGAGSLGLPSGHTVYRVQGVPFRAAALGPGLQDENAALTLGSSGMVRAALLGPSNGMGVGAGGEIEVFNPVLGQNQTDLLFGYSPTALWTGRYDVPDGFTPSSFWGAGRTSISLNSDSVRITVGGDFQHMERPRLALLPGATRFGSPSLEDREISSAFALVDWTLRNGGRIDLGARMGSRPQAAAQFRPAWPGGVSPLEARDAVFGAGGFFPVGRTLNLQARVGVTRSERSWADDAPVEEGTPGLVSLATGRRAGVSPRVAGPSSRNGVYVGVSAGLQDGSHDAALGIDFLRTSHELDPFAGSSFVVGDADPFADGWAGSITSFGNTRGSIPFSTPTLTLFLRDNWTASPEFTLRAGIRWVRQGLPVDELPLADEWASTSGLALPAPNETASGISTYLGFEWSSASAPVSISGSGGIVADEVDPWILAEAIAGDGTAERSRTAGSALDAWPSIPDAASATFSAPMLTFLGESVALPTTTYGQLGIASQMDGVTVGVSGIYRRTENLFRRADLNRVTAPSGVTDAGRNVYGTLSQAGRLAYAEPGSSRRFTDFDHVWFMLQDGWSEQISVTGSLEGELPGGVSLGAWYTWSSTTDNLPGLGTGDPFIAGTVDVPDPDWEEGTSDLDVPHRVGAALAIRLPVLAGGAIRTRFQLQSGRAFTPGVRDGVDLNADGIAGNDPILVPETGIEGVADRLGCLTSDRGRFVERNSCRLPWEPYLNVGLDLGLFRLGEGLVSLQVDALNLLQAFDTATDPALLLVNRSAPLQADGTTFSPALQVNGRMGGEIFDIRQGRMIRLGIRWGGGQ